VLLAQPGDPGWKEITFPRISRHTRWSVVHPAILGGASAWHSEADCSASAMALSLVDMDLSRTPRLLWRWRLRRPLHVSRERRAEGDDFAARVYVLFRFDPARASLWARARQSAAHLVFRREIPGAALEFVWTSQLPPGSRWPNPIAAEARMLALRSGEADGEQFFQEQVDLVAEHRRAFGDARPEPMALAVMTDSDDSCSRASAEFADFRLAARPRTGAP